MVRPVVIGAALMMLPASAGAQSCADFMLVHRVGQDGTYRDLASRYFRTLDQQAVQRGERPTGLTGNSIIESNEQTRKWACAPAQAYLHAQCKPFSIMDNVAENCVGLVWHELGASFRYAWLMVQQHSYVIVSR
jgi:hypothetical protein